MLLPLVVPFWIAVALLKAIGVRV